MSRPAIASAIAVAELEVRLLLVGRRALRQHAGRASSGVRERGRVDQLDAVVAQHVGDRANQPVGVLRLRASSAPIAASDPARCPGEELGVLDLPGHHRLGDAGLPSGG